MSRRVRTELTNGVLTITLADEANRNALGTALVAELLEAFDRADGDDAVRVVVLTNEGRVFCAGADLKEQLALGPDTPAVDLAAVFRRIIDSPKPFVGRVAGHAVAGGMGLAAVLDISVALEDARFGFTEVRVGVAPAIISVVCLPKMRKAEAAEAFLRGNRFTGTEAARIGLVNHAVPADRLDVTVDTVVNDLLAGGPQALAATKQLLTRVPGSDVPEAFAWTAELSRSLFTSEEAAEGMGAYLQKRKPAWAPPESTTEG